MNNDQITHKTLTLLCSKGGIIFGEYARQLFLAKMKGEAFESVPLYTKDVSVWFKNNTDYTQSLDILSIYPNLKVVVDGVPIFSISPIHGMCLEITPFKVNHYQITYYDISISMEKMFDYITSKKTYVTRHQVEDDPGIIKRVMDDLPGYTVSVKDRSLSRFYKDTLDVMYFVVHIYNPGYRYDNVLEYIKKYGKIDTSPLDIEFTGIDMKPYLLQAIGNIIN